MPSKTIGAILMILGILGLIYTLAMSGEQKSYVILLSIFIVVGLILIIVPKKHQPSTQAFRTVAPEPPPPAAVLSKPKEQIKKDCPSCSEKIILEARRCRFCGEIFDPETLKSQIEIGRAQQS